MARKLISAILALILALSLSACDTEQHDAQISDTWNSAMQEIPGVTSVRARYNNNPGMGATGMIQLQIEPGSDDPQAVMLNSMRAFAMLTDGTKSTTSMSYTVSEEGSKVTLTPEVFGLHQKPSIKSIVDYVDGHP